MGQRFGAARSKKIWCSRLSLAFLIHFGFFRLESERKLKQQEATSQQTKNGIIGCVMGGIKRHYNLCDDNNSEMSEEDLLEHVAVIEQKLKVLLAGLDVDREKPAIVHINAGLENIAQFLREARTVSDQRYDLCGTMVDIKALTPAIYCQEQFS